jgi:beta-galactosidase
VLHLAPHWNWKGKEGKEISVWAYSNCDEVELFLNKKSLGKKATPKNSHIEWNVPFEPGTLLARGYKNGKEIITDKVETTGDPATLELSADKTTLNASGEDVSVITVKVSDAKGRPVPTANNEITFTLSGPGKIIGVGNGDPGSHEPDRYFETIEQVKIENLKMRKVENKPDVPEIADNHEDNWTMPFKQQQKYMEKDKDSMKINAIRGTFTLAKFTNATEINLFPKNLCLQQSIYVNGHLIAKDIDAKSPAPKYTLDHANLLEGKNVIVIVGPPLVKRNAWEDLNTNPGLLQVINPAGDWKRALFNGLAQVIVKSTKEAGQLILTANGDGLKPAAVSISAVSGGVSQNN